MKKYFLYSSIVMLIAFIFTAGCASREPAGDPWQLDMQSGMGGLNSSPDAREYSYKLILSHKKTRALEDVRVELLLNERYKNRILQQDGLLGGVRAVLAPNDPVTAEGKMIIDTKDITKQQLEQMGPVLSGVSLNWTEEGKSRNETKNFLDIL